MIKETNYLKYNLTQHHYYLTEAGATELCFNDDVKYWKRPEQRLKLISKLLHDRMIQSTHNQQRVQCRHKDNIEYKVYLDNYGEREAIQQALVYFIEIMGDTDLDRDILNGAKMPDVVLNPLREVGIVFGGKINARVPDEDWAKRGESIEEGGW